MVRVMQVHLAWIKTPRNKGGLGHIKIPLLADVKKVNPKKHTHKQNCSLLMRYPSHKVCLQLNSGCEL